MAVTGSTQGTGTRDRGGSASRRLVVEWAVAAAVGAVGIGLAAYRPVKVTSGWFDQLLFHWPTVDKLAGELPSPDFVDMDTATGPLYHLTAALFTRSFGLSMATTQFVTGLLVWAALAAVLIWALSALTPAVRYLAMVAVFASPYVIQSTFWMTTDALTLTLGVALLAVLIRGDGVMPWGSTLVVAVLAAASVATRQTAVWLVVVGVAAALLTRGLPLQARLARAAAIAAPAAVVLLALSAAWGGATPPSAREANGSGPEPLGLPVGFALWAFFATPLVVWLWSSVPRSRVTVVGAAVSAAVCAAPAVIWKSGYSFPDRMGGWLWKLVNAGGEVVGRSPVLVVLAAVGGAAVFLLLVAIYQRQPAAALLLGVGIYVAILVSTAGSFALPKYREIPLLTVWPVLEGSGHAEGSAEPSRATQDPPGA